VQTWLTPALLLTVLAAVPARSGEVAPVPAADKDAAIALDKKLLSMAEAKNGSEIMANLTYLSDVIGPRLTGSANLKKANEWAAEKMKSYGLTNVALESYTIPVGWERGTATLKLIEPNSGRALTVAALGWTPGTPGKVEGDVVVMNAKNAGELAAYKGKLKNAIVLRGAPAKIAPVTDVSTGYEARPVGGGRRPRPDAGAPTTGAKPEVKPEAKTDEPKTGTKPAEKTPETAAPPFGTGRERGGEEMRQMMAFRKEAAEFLRAEGAAVVLMDSGKPHGLLVTTGAWRGDDRVSGAEPMPSLYVAHEHYAMLHRLASRPAPAVTRAEVEITNTLTPGPIVVYNTVGEIRGSEKPDEFVLLGAHLDSWDLAQGTTDNGTGSSVVLEAARILASCGVKPKRSIRFVLFSGEEQGLHGSKAYVTKHKEELSKMSMALVHDTGTGKVTGLGLQGRTALLPLLQEQFASLKEIGLTDINTRGMGGTDHLSFEQAGVPGFAVQQDPAEYRFTHHTQSDTLDKASEKDLIEGAQVLTVAAMRVANLPTLLSREKPPAEPREGRPTPPQKPVETPKTSEKTASK
jgi:hypothetical protein